MVKFTHRPVALQAEGWHDTGRRISGAAAEALAAVKQANMDKYSTAFRLSTDPDTWGIFTRTPDILT